MNIAESIPARNHHMQWRQLPPLPDAHGFAGGYAGVCGDTLLFAGGANFPDAPLAEGGTKEWSDAVFALEPGQSQWQLVGRLPAVDGYGASGSWRGRMVIAGGGDALRNHGNAALVSLRKGGLHIEALPPLPIATANCSGTAVGDRFYVIGGQAEPDSSATLRRCFVMDLSLPAQERGWEEIELPEAMAGRILAVVAAVDGWFYVFSGADLFQREDGQVDRRYLTDAWRYHPQDGWERLPDLPRAAAAAPSPAFLHGGNRLLIAGGVSPEFLQTLKPGQPHPGFPAEGLVYDSTLRRWSRVPAAIDPQTVPLPHVTAPTAQWNGMQVIISGETAPGIRTPNLIALSENE